MTLIYILFSAFEIFTAKLKLLGTFLGVSSKFQPAFRTIS